MESTMTRHPERLFKMDESETRRPRMRKAPLYVMLGLGTVYLWVMMQSASSLEQAKNTYLLMGTQVEITVVAPRNKQPEALVEGAYREMKKMESLFNYYDPNSFVSRLNALPAGTPLKVQEGEEVVMDVLGTARQISELSDGAFDITFATVGKFWRFDPENPSLPTEEELASVRGKIDYRNVVVDRAAGTVMLKGEGTKINLGGIAKGSAVDRAILYLVNKGAKGALVNAGGDMYAMGYKIDPNRDKSDEEIAPELQQGLKQYSERYPDAEEIPEGMAPWVIGLQHPRDKESILPEGGFEMPSNMAVVTSGDYERMFEFEGKRYSHTINPKTGMPVSGLVSVSVFAQSAEYADALATAFTVMGPEKGPELARKLSGVEALFITEKTEVIHTNGIPDELKSIELKPTK
ncbi:MAG: FAD:protein FMN transferase [Candidatus Sumerlaeia bacterium]